MESGTSAGKVGSRMSSVAAETLRIRAGALTFAALAWGPSDGPLALCLHGYPDTARTWRHLGPHLAEHGWRVVAPYTRGYWPTDLAPDGIYQLGALARDGAELHKALAGDERSVVIGHDWGAETSYVLGACRPELFRRIVTIAVAPAPVLLSPGRRVSDLGLFARQLRLSWYMFFQLLPGISERSLPRLIPRLWNDWSPGYDARDDVPDVLDSLQGPHAAAALRYYRAFFFPWMRSKEYAAEQSHLLEVPPVPLLYLHGERDGCQLPAIASRAADFLQPPSRFAMVEGAGHFLHLERPGAVNDLITAFIEAG
jgi:pimeloyl-ACP methyl ester carboxylesterase